MNNECGYMSKRVMRVGELRELLGGLGDDVLVVSVSAVSSVAGVRVSMLSDEVLDREYDVDLLREDGIEVECDEEVLMFHSVDEEGV